MKVFTASDAKNNFGAVMDSAANEPAEIQKNGKPLAVVVPAKQFQVMWASYMASQVKGRVIEKDREVLEVLSRYSRGEIGMMDAQRYLGLAYPAEVLDMLGLANLSMPMLPERTINEMVNEAMEVMHNDE